MTGESAENKDLCKAQYWAYQLSGTVTLHAVGAHPKAGYKVVLEKSFLDISPPEHILRHVAPDGPVAQVETPFSVSTSFDVAEAIRSVAVHDVDGEHTIPVNQVSTCEG